MHPGRLGGTKSSRTLKAAASLGRVEYHLIPERRLVRVKFGKRLSERDLAGYAASLREDRQFDPAFSEIVDLTAVEKIELRGDEMLNLADEIDPFSPHSKRAFVVQTPIQAHAARMHQILRVGSSHIQIFSSVADAEQWIGNSPTE